MATASSLVADKQTIIVDQRVHRRQSAPHRDRCFASLLLRLLIAMDPTERGTVESPGPRYRAYTAEPGSYARWAGQTSINKSRHAN